MSLRALLILSALGASAAVGFACTAADDDGLGSNPGGTGSPNDPDRRGDGSIPCDVGQVDASNPVDQGDASCTPNPTGDGGPGIGGTEGLCTSNADCDEGRRCTNGDPGVCLKPPGCSAPGANCPATCYGACVFLGELDLAFSSGPSLTASSYENYFGVLLADFTGDGYADVLLTDHLGGDENHYWSGNGQGNFTLLNRTTFGVDQAVNGPRGCLWVNQLDLDQDGKLDWYWDDVSPPSLRRNTGGGVFQELSATSYGSGRIRGFYLRPGTNVMAFATSEGFLIRGEAILNGTISTVTGSSTPQSHADVLAKVNCDPIAYHGTAICPTDIGSTNADRARFKIPSVVLADFNDDGTMDLVVSYGDSFSPTTEPRVYRGVGNGTYALETTLPARLRGPYADYSNIVAADFDNDGLVDLALAGVSVPGQSGVRTAIYKNNGGFTFAYATGFTEGASGNGGKDFVAAGDYDNDGRIDIAVISNNGVKLHRNTSAPK